MHSILVAGAGKIGRLIACLLSESKDFKVYLSDVDIESFDASCLGSEKSNIELVRLDATNKASVADFIQKQKIQSVVSSLPFFCNIPLAEIAREHHVHYFDLTEDTAVTDAVKALSEGAQSAFVPQCGLAPGFISISANELIKHFDKVDAVLMRVGALPVYPNNALKYSLTWSTDGLINEYGNTCYGIVQGKEQPLIPLEGLETIEIDGLLYEAFNTSGGLGSLGQTYEGKVQTMNYKTLRYPGHCKQMRLLMNDLKLNEDRETLRRILEGSIPKTTQDVVVVYVAVRGMQNNELIEETYVKKVYPAQIAGKTWSAIQVTTAGGVCAVVDKVVKNEKDYQGLVLQEHFSLKDITENRFGKYYA